MAFPLLSSSFLARSEVDEAHMHEVLRNWTMLPTRKEAVARAKDQMAENLAIRSVRCFVLTADDSVVLADIGPRGGFCQLHHFGRA